MSHDEIRKRADARRGLIVGQQANEDLLVLLAEVVRLQRIEEAARRCMDDWDLVNDDAKCWWDLAEALAVGGDPE